MGKSKKTHDTFIKEVYELTKNEYKVLSIYDGAYKKVKFLHEKCGRTFEMRPHDFLRGQRCSNCFGIKKSNTEEFKKYVKEQTGDEYEVVGQYVNNRTPIEIKHNVCGKILKMRPDNFKSGKRCIFCMRKQNGIKDRKNPEVFKKQFEERANNEYELLDEYIKNTTKITIKHIKCGNVFKMTPMKFLSGQNCPECYGNKIKRHEKFLKEVFELVGNEYSVLGEYKNNREKLTIKHNECGFEYEVAPTKFLTGRRCPKCNESKGEKKISDYLKQYNISFIPQYKFDNCKNIFSLPFDFAVFNNDNLFCLIEFDGEQHFKPCFGEEKFLQTTRNDGIKNKFCEKNNIKLIRIRYNRINKIDKILERELKTLHGNTEPSTMVTL